MIRDIIGWIILGLMIVVTVMLIAGYRNSFTIASDFLALGWSLRGIMESKKW